MNLSKQQFRQLLKDKKLVISLIGMSNMGKTYYSKKFNAIGFNHLCCDELIQEKLTPYLAPKNCSNIVDVSQWMGQPYDEKFFNNQQKYLSFEKEALENILAEIKNKKTNNTVIDTTGSVVHTGRDLCLKLKQNSLIIYIKASESMKEEMFKKYIKEPKPVVFENIFVKKKNETNIDALERCYKKLLNLRESYYSEYADIVLPSENIKHSMDAYQFISLIEKSL